MTARRDIPTPAISGSHDCVACSFAAPPLSDFNPSGDLAEGQRDTSRHSHSSLHCACVFARARPPSMDARISSSADGRW
ncbi:hypothetical protein HYPSUDRAFT_73086 [Hypholoma sublateritium FD-334 SS-4]|uniref:Uncharacterized protein n=1 Tax=Hypholoma sublateritium (strain FD-334 SS-4) TaxID=945553 RepID=A0A0D2N9G1_HYPSF|nr:hypothetical protein HYPSUDRAFT_73086 [Hypholoma sublateritium FD-334 SS-4]